MSRGIGNPKGAPPFVLVLVIVVLGTIAICMSLLRLGCGKASPETVTKARQEQAFEIVTGMTWIRDPDIKGKCFGVYATHDGASSPVGIVVLDCKYVEHKLANPSPPALPEKEGEE